MDDNLNILSGLKSDSAKRRESVIKTLSPLALQDARVIEALQRVVSTDPVEYVREAARAQLLAAGQIPAQSVVPAQLGQQSNTPITWVILGCIILPVALIVLSIAVILILAITGPQIGNIFSRVTNGLGGP